MKKIIFLLSLCFTFLVCTMSSCQNYSTGERVGIITKVSEKGAIWKSNEVEVKVSPTIASGNTQMIGDYEDFCFSIDNDNTIPFTSSLDSLSYYAQKGIPVIIYYQQTYGLNWWNNRGETNYFIKCVRRAQ